MKCVGKSVLRKEGTKRSVLVISMGPMTMQLCDKENDLCNLGGMYSK